MTNKSAQKTWRSRLAVAAVGLGLAVAGAACSEGLDAPTSPSGASPSLAANAGQDTRNFSVTMTPATVQVGVATLHVTVARDITSGQSQKIGSVEIYVPAGLTLQSVENFSNQNWTGGVSGQTVRVGAPGGNQKLDGTSGRISVEFDINVTSTKCGSYDLSAKASNKTFTELFDANWAYIGNPLSVEVTGCVPPPVEECKAASAIAAEYLDSINLTGRRRGEIESSVAHNMTQGARFDDMNKCDPAYRAAVIAFVIALL